MPIALDPHETFEIVLESDKDKDQADQPAYVLHYLTRREGRQARAVYDGMEGMADGDEAIDKICDCLRSQLAGWRNMTDRQGEPIPFDPDRLEETAGDLELVELFVKMLGGGRLGGSDAKKSGLPSHTDTDESAKPANPESA